jgi:hypothetical protein
MTANALQIQGIDIARILMARQQRQQHEREQRLDALAAFQAQTEAQKLQQAQQVEQRKSKDQQRLTVARMLEQYPDRAEQIGEMARRAGIEMPGVSVTIPEDELPGPYGEMLKKNSHLADRFLMPRAKRIEAQPVGDAATERAASNADELRLQAAGTQGVPKAEEPELDAIGKRIVLERKQRPGTPEFQRSYSELAAEEKATKLAEGRMKHGGSPADIRKEFQALPIVKETQAASVSYDKIRGAPDSGIGDITLLYGFMKMQDPNSTVREGEYATAENAGGIDDRIRNLYNKAIGGDVLTKELRQGFKNEAARLYGTQLQAFDAKAEEFRGLAQRAGHSPEDIGALDAGIVRPSQSKAALSSQQKQAVVDQMNAMHAKLVASGIDDAQAQQIVLQKFKQGGQ